MIIPSEFTDYFKFLATNHKDILHTEENNHFYEMETMEELLADLRDGLNFPLVVLECPEFIFSDPDFDNVMENSTGSFMILVDVDLNDYEAQRAAKDLTKKIAISFISKMRNDRKPSANTVMEGLQIDKIKGNFVGPIFENAFGWRVVFEIEQDIDLSYKEADWNE
jgi:hypothetical protein